MSIIKPFWMAHNTQKEIDKVRKIQDLGTLKKIAKSSPFPDLRIEAILKIDKWDAIEEIMMYEADKQVYLKTYEHILKVIDKIDSQVLLARIAKHDLFSMKVIDKINESSNVSKFELLHVINEKMANLRAKAINLIVDEYVIHDIVARENSRVVAFVGIEKINDPDLIEDIALHNEFDDFRKMAIEKVENIDILKKIMANDHCDQVREYAEIKFNKCKKLYFALNKASTTKEIVSILRSSHMNYLADEVGIVLDNHIIVNLNDQRDLHKKTKLIEKYHISAEKLIQLSRKCPYKITYVFDIVDNALQNFTVTEISIDENGHSKSVDNTYEYKLVPHLDWKLK